MTAGALAGARPVGRPSNADLTLRTHVLQAEVDRLEEDRADLVSEIAAIAAEHTDLSAQLLDIARTGLRHLSVGATPKYQLLDLERVAIRTGQRALALGIHDDAPDVEPVGVLMAVPA